MGDQGHALWLLQLAHALGVLNSTMPLLKAYPVVAEHTAAIADSLSKEASLGKYSTHHRRIKDQDLWKLLRRSQSHACLDSVPAGAPEAVPLSVMLRSRRGI